MNQVTLSKEMYDAFRTIELTNANVFITGKAGTGKTTFLQYLRKHTRKQFAVLASTGVAALNVQGQTIHSFFRFPARFLDKSAIRKDKRSMFKELDLLIIDEISMVRADVFDAIDHHLRLNGKYKNKPFGGVQICVIGDLLQLPPVVSTHEQEFFRQYYVSPYFFDTESYRMGEFDVVEFSHIYRQTDEYFCQLLNQVRDGVADRELLGALNGHVKEGVVRPDDIVLTGTNAAADAINHAKLSALSGTPYQFQGAFTGEFNREAGRLPAAELLTLKKGAQVMFIRNDSKGGQYVNGTIGQVVSLGEEEIIVETDSGKVEVKPEKWETFAYELNEEKGTIEQKVKGAYAQYPLALAWAVTIHKAQGKTLDRAVIDLGRGAFAPGQLYVALSRCRTLEGITLKRRVSASDIKSDMRVLHYLQNKHNYRRPELEMLEPPQMRFAEM